jgi:hypothetical protein
MFNVQGSHVDTGKRAAKKNHTSDMTICTGQVIIMCTTSDTGSMTLLDAWLHRCARALHRLVPVRKHSTMPILMTFLEVPAWFVGKGAAIWIGQYVICGGPCTAPFHISILNQKRS